MDKPEIGIRQADGSFYPILQDAQGARKRMVLSASRPDQKNAKIELYRSSTGTLEGATPLGTMTVDSLGELSLDEIQFQVNLDADGLLQASAGLPGQPPQNLSVDLLLFRDLDPPLADDSYDVGSPRSDSEILADPEWDSVELDTLDFPEPEPEPRVEAPGLPEAPELEIADSLSEPVLDEPEFPAWDEPLLADDSLPSPTEEPSADPEIPEFDLPDMNWDSLPEIDEPSSPAELSAPDLDLSDTELETAGAEVPLPDWDPSSATDAPPLVAESFDLGDLDAGFGAPSEPDTDSGEEWEKLALDDMEAIEFLDTGDQLSAPSELSDAPDSFSMDDENPLELNDSSDDFGDLPDLDDLGDNPSSRSDDAWVPPPWEPKDSSIDPEEVVPVSPSKKAKDKPAKKVRPSKDLGSSPEPLGKTALVFSLIALTALLILVVGLLFLNLVRPAVAPVPGPEVQRWQASPLAERRVGHSGEIVDLGALDAPMFTARSVTEVPQSLVASTVQYRLRSGETVAMVEERFGVPARQSGSDLVW